MSDTSFFSGFIQSANGESFGHYHYQRYVRQYISQYIEQYIKQYVEQYVEQHK
ncbi:hypothetical protein APSETT444_009871 [Aspergillus pseudonomiae]